MPICTACESDTTTLLGSRLFLKKYEANIYNCNNCNLVFVENPHWLNEAYSMKYDTDIDAGRYMRNEIVCNYIKDIFGSSDKLSLLDFGSGEEKILENYLDKSTSNITAVSYDKYFDNDSYKLENKYNIFTAIEVAEHIKPKEFWDFCIDKADHFIITTGLHDDKDVLDWEYFARDYGQHINLYSFRTLKYIAKKYKLKVSYKRLENEINIIHFRKV